MGDIIFFIVLALLIALSLIFIFKDDLKSIKFGFFKNITIKKYVKRIAVDHDFLYMSNIVIRVNQSKDTHIDNILITNKNIYIIKNVFWKGILRGKEADEKWFLKDNNGLNYVDNPLNLNHLRIKILSANIEVPLDHFQNVIFYGDSLDVYELDINNSNSLFVNYKKFEKKLMEIEKNTPDCFNDQEIEKIAQLIYDKSQTSLSHRRGK